MKLNRLLVYYHLRLSFVLGFVLFLYGKPIQGVDLTIQISGNLRQHGSFYRLDYSPPHGNPPSNTTIASRDIRDVIEFSQGLPGTSYEFWLYTSNSTGQGWQLSWTASLTTTPDPPSNLSVQVIDGNVANITWSPPARGNYSGFQLKVLSSSDDPGAYSTKGKVDNAKKTGAGGGRDAKLNEIDVAVLNIIGKDSPGVVSLDVPETFETAPHCSSLPAPVEGTASVADACEASPRNSEKCRKRKAVPEDGRLQKVELQKEYLKLKSRKLALEIIELESRLGLEPSEATAVYYPAAQQRAIIVDANGCNIVNNWEVVND